MRRRILWLVLIVLALIGIRVGTDLYTGNNPRHVLDLLGELVSTASNRSVLIGLILAAVGLIGLSILLPIGLVWLLNHVSDDTKAERSRDEEARVIEEKIARLGSSPSRYPDDRARRPRIDG